MIAYAHMRGSLSGGTVLTGITLERMGSDVEAQMKVHRRDANVGRCVCVCVCSRVLGCV